MGDGAPRRAGQFTSRLSVSVSSLSLVATFLHGREYVLAQVSEALDDGAGGRGRLLLITGEPGIGKTAVASEAARRARERGMDVRWGACLEGDLSVPFGPWIEILGPQGAAAIAGGAESSSTATDPQEAAWRRLVAFHAVLEQLRSRAAMRPLLVVLEDLHWADTPSQLMLRYVAAHLGAVERVVLLGTCRDLEVDVAAPIGALVAGAERIMLTGLDERAVAQLVADVSGEAVSPAVAADLCRVTGGNPFFVTQVARLRLDRALRLAELTVPSEVHAVLSRRLDRLDELTIRVLGGAAALGEQFDIDVVADTTAASGEEVLRALQVGQRTGIVRRVDGAGQRWAFVHALFQQVCAERLALSTCVGLHRRAAAALERRGADPSAVAQHLRRAGLPNDDPRLAQAELAAGAAALDKLAWEDAAAHFARAVAAAPPGSDHDKLRAEALLRLGTARLRAGDAEGAGVSFQAAADVARHRGWADVVAQAALGFGVGFGGFEIRMLDQRQIELLEQAVAVLPEESDLRPWVLARLSVALSFIGSPQRRLALANEAIAVARARADRAALAAALAARCDAVAGPDHVSERLGAATEIIILATEAEDRPLELLGRRHRIIALSELGSMTDVDEEIAAFDRVAKLHGDPLYRWYVPLWRGMRALARGEVTQAERYADEARQLGARAGSANALVLSEMLWFVLLVERRSPTAPRRFRELAVEHPELVGPAGLPMLVWILAAVGEEAQARQHLAEICAAGIDRIPRDAEWLPVMTQLAEAAVVLGDRVLAAELRTHLEAYGRLCVVEGIGAAQRGSVARAVALLAALLGERDAALASLDRARRIDEPIGALLAAHVRYATARVLRLVGAPADQLAAGDHALDAADRYRALGLDALAKEAAALATDGVPPKRKGEAKAEGRFRREGDVWELSWEGATARVRHSKGIGDLAVLVTRPGVEVHVRELAGAVGRAARTARSDDMVLDRQAVAEYRRRLAELESEVADAEDAADLERAAQLRAERDFFVAELAAAFGLRGRARPAAGDVDERIRKAVSARIRDALRRLDAVHPAAANHFRHSIRTGLWCAYEPERPTLWQVDAG